MTVDILDAIGSPLTGDDSGGIRWFSPCSLNVRELAAAMKECNARFVTITATQLPREEGMAFDYIWDLDGQLMGFVFCRTDNSMESIYDLCEAADWIEREIHEEFAVNFTGREYEPLLLRLGNKVGVNLREGPR